MKIALKPVQTYGSDEAIPLIRLTQSGYDINPEALQFIASIDSYLSIITVCGKYRTGKSYLINKIILGEEHGFNVGPTIQPCTKGIWLWKRPFQLTEASDSYVLIMDTEGLAALDEEANHDTKVMTLALLISSLLIYNSVGAIDENALQSLGLVIDIANKIQQENNKDVSEDFIAKNFPSFLWVLRDFSLRLEDSMKNPISSKQYLENCLTAQKGLSDMVESKNRIRKLFKTFFSDRDCFTLVRPIENEKDLQSLSKLEDKMLRKEFILQSEQLRNKILKKVKPKIVNQKRVKGSTLANLIESYTKSVNVGRIPSIDNAWAYICKNEEEKALHDMEESYLKQLEESLIIGKVTYQQNYKLTKERIQNNVIAEYKKKMASFLDALPNSNDIYSLLSKTYDKFKRKYYNMCIEMCTKCVTDSIEEIKAQITSLPSQDIYLPEILSKSIGQIPEAITGCKYFHEVFTNTLLEEIPKITDLCIQSSQAAHNIEMQQHKEKIIELESTLSEKNKIINANEDTHNEMAKIKQDNENYQKEMEQYNTNLQQYQNEMTKLSTAMHAMQAQMDNYKTNEAKLSEQSEQLNKATQQIEMLTKDNIEKDRVLTQVNSLNLWDEENPMSQSLIGRMKPGTIKSRCKHESNPDYWKRQYLMLRQQAEHTNKLQESMIDTINEKFTIALSNDSSLNTHIKVYSSLEPTAMHQ